MAACGSLCSRFSVSNNILLLRLGEFARLPLVMRLRQSHAEKLRDEREFWSRLFCVRNHLYSPTSTVAADVAAAPSHDGDDGVSLPNGKSTDSLSSIPAFKVFLEIFLGVIVRSGDAGFRFGNGFRLLTNSRSFSGTLALPLTSSACLERLSHGEAFVGDNSNFGRNCVKGPLQTVKVIGYGKMAADEGERSSAVSDAGPMASSGEEEAANFLEPPRRFAVLTAGHAADYTTKTYGGYGPMFVKMLREPGEIWDEILVVEGQFPSEEELDKYEGFVITGSRHDAHGHEEWIQKLCSLLQKLHERRRKLLGVCFGHQVLSRALGGKTGRAPAGWEVGLRDITPTPALLAKSYGVGLPPKIKILEVHQDQVLEMPPGAELLASSERTGIEMYSVGEHALAIQGHPEFFDDVVLDLLNNRLSEMMKEDDIKEAKASLSAACADQNVWQKLCKDFLKGQQQSQS